MKFDEEKIFTTTIDEKSTKMSDSEINEKYKRGEIRIVTEQARYPIKSIKGMLDSDDYKLNPEYQRRKRWDNGKKSRLIESFIMNVPLPPIFLYEYEYSKYEVMDGLQRLTSIYDFYSGEFALEGLQYWTELNGRYIHQLPQEIQKGIDRRYISSIVLLEETAKSEQEAEKLKQIVFERLNSGGEKLTAQETRNALYNGKFNQLCIKLTENIQFKKMWNIPQSSDENALLNSSVYRKMVDVELVLRFFAYRFIDDFKGVSIENALDYYLKQANLFPQSTIDQLEEVFVQVIDLAYTIFEEEAFKAPKHERKVDRPQKFIYDPLMQSLSKYLKYKDILIKEAAYIRSNIYNNKIDANGERIFEGRKNNPMDVITRIEYFDKFFETLVK